MNDLYDRRREEARVTSAWLAGHVDDSDLLVIDMRKGDGYPVAPAPGAVAPGVSPFLHSSGDALAAGEFAAMMSRLGVEAGSRIVAYDDGNGLFAARLWWAARHYGHARVEVVDGGWDLWLAEGRAASVAPPQRRTTSFLARPRARVIALSEDVRAALGSAAVTLLDGRGDDEWTRTISAGSSVAGHIPGARHLARSTVIDAATRRYRGGAALRTLLLDAGGVPGTEVIRYCQGGLRAAHTMLALFLAEFDSARNHEGSWAAWSTCGAAIEPFEQNSTGGV